MKIELSRHSYPGRLIVISGVDGSGKSTLIQSLVSKLDKRFKKSGESIHCFCQPSDWWRKDPRVRGTIVNERDGILADELALGLFAIADRLNQQTMHIEPALKEGAVVLVNRYVFDMLAYYMAKSHSDINFLIRSASLLLRPDLSIFLDCPSDILVNRVKNRDGVNDRRYDQSLEITDRIMQSYRSLLEDNDILPISSDQPMPCMVGQAISAVDKCLKFDYIPLTEAKR